MLDIDSLLRHRGDEVFDEEGRKIGRLEEIYLDDDTDEPKWALVHTGSFSSRHVFVPLEGAQTTDRALRVGYSRSLVAEAPRVEGDEHLSVEEEAALARHYGVSAQSTRPSDRPDADAGTAETTATAPADPSAGREGAGASGQQGAGADDALTGSEGIGTDDAMTRSEEELHVEKRQRTAGRARLRKYVVTEHVTITVPVQREEVRVEREPAAGTDATAPAAGDATVVDAGPATEADVRRAGLDPEDAPEGAEVILHEEEVVVETRVVPKERVRLAKDVVTEERQIEGDVRRERIDVERDGPDDGR